MCYVRTLLFFLSFFVCLSRVTLYDYQAICWIYSESSDSGHTLLDVSATFCHTVPPPFLHKLLNRSFMVMRHYCFFFTCCALLVSDLCSSSLP